MIILDTNVLSALMRRAPERDVVHWLDQQPRTSIWTTSITVLEIHFGLQLVAAGRRRAELLSAFEALLADKIGGRIAPFDNAGAEQAAGLMAKQHKQGRPGDLRDTIVAGIAVAHRATLATRNVAHFADLPVPVVNPWAAGSSR